jgi:hypothetical protein
MPESQYSISAIISVGEKNPTYITWNSASPLNSSAELVNDDYSYNTLVVTLAQGSTITGGVVTFQGSTDGVNWFNMQGFIPGTTNTVGPTYTLTPNTYGVFEFNLTAVPYFQVLLTTVITGTGSVVIGYVADSFVNPAPVSAASSGSTTGNAPTIVAIATSSTLVLAANPLRKGLNLVNMSYETISLSFGGSAAVLFSGVNLGPGGTFWMDAADFTTAAVNAISTLTAAGGYLGVQEFQ